MMDSHNALPALPYVLRFSTGKVPLSKVTVDRELKNGTIRFSALAKKSGSLYVGDTFLGRIKVNGDATGFTFTGGSVGITKERLRELILHASIRVCLSAGPAWIHPEDASFQPGRLIQLDTDLSKGIELLFHDSGACIARGEALSVDGYWGLRVQELRSATEVEAEPKGYIAARVVPGFIDLTVGDLLGLGEGSILKFNTPVDAPLALEIGGSVQARGSLRVYKYRQSSFRQTFTRQGPEGEPKVFLRLDGPLPEQKQALEAATAESCQSLGGLLKIIHQERLFLFLKASPTDTAAFLLKCCVAADKEKAASLLHRLSDRPGLISAFINCAPAANIAHLERVFSRSLASLCSQEELRKAIHEPSTNYNVLSDTVRSSAEAVASLPLDAQKEILSCLQSGDAYLAEAFRSWFFFVEDLVHLDDLSVQKLLRKADSDQLAVVLAGSGEKVKEKIYSNMSKRAAQMLEEDIGIMGSVDSKRFEEEAGRVLSQLRSLIDTGDIIV